MPREVSTASPAHSAPASVGPAASAAVLRDGFGRRIESLRLSVTDRCNLRCTYCLPPEGIAHSPRSSLLTHEQMVLAVRVAVGLGIRNVRVTGGEPLLRRGLPDLIRGLSAIPGLDDIALTTNGILLARQAEALAEAGLRRLNVSVDGLDAETFASMTRHRGLDAVWEGIAAASAAGMGPIRLNVVVLKGVNDHEVDAWVRRAVDHDLVVRFLELMPIGEGAKVYAAGGFADLTAIREDLATRWDLEPVDEPLGNGPSVYWRVPGGKGSIGFITPLSAPYCDSCSRMRLSSDGRLRACLASDAVVDALAAIRSGDEEAIVAAFRWAAASKSEGHHWREGQATRTGMSQMGG